MKAAEPIHVVPVNDLKEHEERGTTCWCYPQVYEEDGETVVVHNSLDGRELIERHGLQ